LLGSLLIGPQIQGIRLCFSMMMWWNWILGPILMVKTFIVHFGFYGLIPNFLLLLLYHVGSTLLFFSSLLINGWFFNLQDISWTVHLQWHSTLCLIPYLKLHVRQLTRESRCWPFISKVNFFTSCECVMCPRKDRFETCGLLFPNAEDIASNS